METNDPCIQDIKVKTEESPTGITPDSGSLELTLPAVLQQENEDSKLNWRIEVRYENDKPVVKLTQDSPGRLSFSASSDNCLAAVQVIKKEIIDAGEQDQTDVCRSNLTIRDAVSKDVNDDVERHADNGKGVNLTKEIDIDYVKIETVDSIDAKNCLSVDQTRQTGNSEFSEGRKMYCDDITARKETDYTRLDTEYEDSEDETAADDHQLLNSADDHELDSDYDPLGAQVSASSDSDYVPEISKRPRKSTKAKAAPSTHTHGTEAECENSSEDELATKESKTDTGRRRTSRKQPYICGICEKTFPLKKELSSHMRRHTGEKPYTCEVCEKEFAHASSMRDHYKLHTDQRPHQCEECPKRFTKASHLQLHIDRCHSRNELKCGVCDKTFKALPDLRIHILRHTKKENTHEMSEIPGSVSESHLSSPKAQGETSVSKSPKNHRTNREYPYVTVNKEETEYKCDECGRVYKNRRNLTDHKRSHLPKRPFTCDKCGRGFTDLSNFRRHKKIHEEGPMFQNKVLHIAQLRYI